MLTLGETFSGFIAVFVACELGQRVTNAFHVISLTIEEMNWYLLPIEIQQILPTIIARSQDPVTLECFGSIKLSREVFKQVD